MTEEDLLLINQLMLKAADNKLYSVASELKKAKTNLVIHLHEVFNNEIIKKLNQ